MVIVLGLVHKKLWTFYCFTTGVFNHFLYFLVPPSLWKMIQFWLDQIIFQHGFLKNQSHSGLGFSRLVNYYPDALVHETGSFAYMISLWFRWFFFQLLRISWFLQCASDCNGRLCTEFFALWERSANVFWANYGVILLMDEILHQLIGSLSYYLQVFIHPRWRRISSINSSWSEISSNPDLWFGCRWFCVCVWVKLPV